MSGKMVAQATPELDAAVQQLHDKEAVLKRELDRVLQPAITSVSMTLRHRAEAVRGVATLFVASGEESYYGELTRNQILQNSDAARGEMVMIFEPAVGWRLTARTDDRGGRLRFIRYREILPVLRLMVGMSSDVLAEASDALAVEALLRAIDDLLI